MATRIIIDIDTVLTSAQWCELVTNIKFAVDTFIDIQEYGINVNND